MNERFQVAARRRGAPPRREDACRVGALRRIAAARLGRYGLAVMVDDVMLVVSELVTNAVLHSGSQEIVVRIGVGDGFLHIVVADGMPGAATRGQSGSDSESGRGLALVEAVAHSHGGGWGSADDGRATWCTLALPAGVQP
ncbi:ATP-binding protein [Streptomyces sp. NPDC058678]|uniref:ATP-binding protein n=1 Tax=Streptomyces sp. NPDC058678 TaxID=3346595 RepID=UPI00365F7108